MGYLKHQNITVVRDHCHFTGKFRGAAHQHCNLMYRKTMKIPAFFHNFTEYDSHLPFQNLSCLQKAPEVVAKGLEKFTSMSIGNIQIKDSLNFMGISLDKLVKNLKEKGKKENKSLQETFPLTYEYFKKYWSHVGEDAFEMLTRKGVYPYEYWIQLKSLEKNRCQKLNTFTVV